MNLWIKYFKDNESSSDVGWSSTQSSTNASPLHQGKKYRDIKLTNVHKTYCMSKVDIQGIQLFKVINLKQSEIQQFMTVELNQEVFDSFESSLNGFWGFIISVSSFPPSRVNSDASKCHQ